MLFSIQQREVKAPFVLVELRAVTPKGNPLAGAKVEFGDQQMGVTDSFGEWRRYLRLAPGTRVRVRMTKEHQGHTFLAENVLQVPRPGRDGREPELKSSLALQVHDPRRRVNQAEKSQGSQERRLGRQDDLRVRPSYLSQNHLTSIDIRYVVFEGQTGSIMERHQSGVLRNRIIPELIAQAEEQGVRMDRQSGWKFLLAYIPYENDVGFIRGELIWRDHRGRPVKNSFITTFAKTIEGSARTLLQQAKRHVSKHYGASYHNGSWYLADFQGSDFWRLNSHTALIDPTGEWLSLRPGKDGEGRPAWILEGKNNRPCSTIPQGDECPLRTVSIREQAPNPAWGVRQLQVIGSLPEKAEIYVSGYQAYPSRNGQWAYWGESEGKVMVTIIQNQRIFHRVRLGSEPGQALTLRLPGYTAQQNQASAAQRF